MKALTLWQPWASLVALGVKTIETRSWNTSYRGPLAIHAAKTMPSHASRYVSGAIASRDVWGDWFVHFLSTLSAPMPRGLPAPRYGEVGYPLPLGAVVATCTLVDVVPTEQIRWGEADGWRDGRTVLVLPERHRPYGDFSPGRYAWLLADITALAESVPAMGRQGLWEWAARSKHAHSDLCRTCGGPTRTIGITKLVYTFEACDCGDPEYPHLVETLWHRACLPPVECDAFRPFHVKATSSRPGRDTEDCYVCGRPESAHVDQGTR